MLRKSWMVFFCLAVFGLVACSKKEGEGMPPVFVTMAPVKEQDWQASVQATGSLQAVQGAQIKSEVAGRVTKIYFTSGQSVHAGDLLIDINPTVLRAQYNAAEANAKLQESNYQRSKILYRQKVISKADYDNALANKENTKSLAEAAAASLAQASIHAPFDGTVGINLVNVGDYAAVGTPLLNLEQLDRVRVDFSVPENYAGKVKVGDKVSLASEDSDAKPVLGQVTGVDTAIDQTTRLLALQAIVPNDAAHHLLPGAFSQVTLFYGPVTQTLSVPQTAIVYDGKTHKVYVPENQKAKEIPIEVGERFSDQVIVKSGLKPGQVIITSGLIKLHEGSPIIDLASMSKMAPPKK